MPTANAGGVDPERGAHGQPSSDRSIRDYCRDIWRVQPTKIALLSEDEVTGDLLQ